MKAKSGDLVEATRADGTTVQSKAEWAFPTGIVFRTEIGWERFSWDRVRLVAASVDITPVEAHAVYSMIVSHLPENFTTDQKAALTSVLNKIQRVARAAEE